jgi:hypothetical protein
VSKEEMYAPPDYAQASARLREDVVTEGGKLVGKRRIRARAGMLECPQLFMSRHDLTFTYFAHTFFLQGRARRVKYWPTPRRRPAISSSSRSLTANEISIRKLAMRIIYDVAGMPCVKRGGFVNRNA